MKTDYAAKGMYYLHLSFVFILCQLGFGRYEMPLCIVILCTLASFERLTKVFGRQFTRINEHIRSIWGFAIVSNRMYLIRFN